MTGSETVLFDGTTVLKEIDTKLIHEAPWNVNVMDPETYAMLVEDLRTVGPKGMDPIHVARIRDLKDELFTIDGAQRLKAVKELKWESTPSVFHNDITTEQEARLFNYRRDAERGQIDQFRLGESFQWFVKQGKNQEQIADMFGIDRSTVSKRLSLTNLDSRVKTKLLKETDVTVSHLEPISTLQPDQQVEAANHLKDYTYGGPITVKQVQNLVDGIKKREGLRQAWLDRVKNAKFPKCPKCKQDPTPPTSWYNVDDTYLHCGNRHEWSMKTGKDPNQESLDNMTHTGKTRIFKEPKKPRTWPQQIRSQHETGEFDEAYWSFFKELWPKLATVEKVSLKGTLKNGEKVDLEYHWLEGYAGTKSNSFGYRTGGGYGYNKEGDIFLKVEKMEAPTLIKKGFNSRVFAWRPITGQKQLDELTETSEKFLSDYGKVPRGTKAEKKK